MNAIERSVATSVLLFLAACTGPKPEVADVKIKDDPVRPGAYDVEVQVRNKGSGKGQAKLKVRLVNPATGTTYQEDKDIDLQSKESTVVHVTVEAPKAAYQPNIEVEYPPK